MDPLSPVCSLVGHLPDQSGSYTRKNDTEAKCPQIQKLQASGLQKPWLQVIKDIMEFTKKKNKKTQKYQQQKNEGVRDSVSGNRPWNKLSWEEEGRKTDRTINVYGMHELLFDSASDLILTI